MVEAPRWGIRTDASALLEHVDFYRQDACRKLAETKRAEMGQFLTPTPVARLMASMFKAPANSLRLLDAGAGVGSLTAAWVADISARAERPQSLAVTAYELDPLLADYLSSTLAMCRAHCEALGIHFSGELFREDFINAAVDRLVTPLFRQSDAGFDCAILNPPYRKIHYCPAIS